MPLTPEEAVIEKLKAMNVKLVDALMAIYNRHNAETMARARDVIGSSRLLIKQLKGGV